VYPLGPATTPQPNDTHSRVVVPLYAAAPTTATRNPALYRLLVLVDAVRIGRARERTRAKQRLRRIAP